ncbi:uncharacterized protein LOC132738297 [Ruditapes philippinarum]|uniref:uncharacterized protein LOC132738297 n=1 Tax=Ruditapes philippinarum TaxID=129788 RepID=UPI00295AA222|nr:uncharacterized protein LOC132738297 [Ruditapes philippinarum]
MSGFKNESQIIEGLATRGKCEPEKSNINFIVPAVRNLRAFSPYDEIIQGGRKPGIFKDVMEFMASSWKNSSLCLTFDGKKLKQGLGKDSGDIDLLGYEDGPSLSTRVTDMKSRMQSCEDEIQRISSNEEDVDIRCLPEDVKLKLICFLKTSYTIVSLDVVTVQEVRNKKEYARSQFVERGGKDWRQSKFVYVISIIDAFLHDIDKFLELTRDILGHIRQVLVYLQESDVFYVTSSSVCLELHDKFVPLVEDHTQTNQSEDTRKIKQRSQRWHEIRNTAFITGSTIYQSIGLDGLKRQRQHFDKVVCGIPEPEPSIEQKRAMEHGTNNEINGVATLVGRILPVIAPTLEFHEEGCVCIKDKDTMIMVVSPDGSLYISETKEIIAGVEIKCPVGKVHSSFPVRYYLQCLSEIEALGVEFLYYVCWTQEITSVFKIEKDTAIFERAIEIAKDIYVTERKRPTKIKEAAKVLKNDIKKKIASIQMIGEYPSIVASENCLINQNLQEKACSQQRHTVADTKDLLQNLELESNESFEILRQKATEAMVFLCCDLDRAWAVEKVRWSPVCWFPKGYSLTTETVRKIMEKVLDECKSVGIHVPACSFDGQWHNIGVRTCTGKPLTVLQLQKDVWVEVQKMSKSSIEKELKSIKIKPQWHKVNGSLEVVSALPRLPKTPTKGWTKKPKRTNTNDKEILEEDTSLLDVLPTEVVEAGGNNAELLSCTYDHFVVEEIVNCNTDEEIWANALIDVIDQVDDLNDNEKHRRNMQYSLTRHQLEVRSIDSTHLLTRTRRKTCKGGIEGFTNEPWLKVARQGKSLLTPAMVEEIVDPMSMSMANTHFSQAVQNAMQENGDFRAASLCADILDWWRAEDEAGISATERECQ